MQAGAQQASCHCVHHDMQMAHAHPGKCQFLLTKGQPPAELAEIK